MRVLLGLLLAFGLLFGQRAHFQQNEPSAFFGTPSEQQEAAQDEPLQDESLQEEPMQEETIRVEEQPAVRVESPIAPMFMPERAASDAEESQVVPQVLYLHYEQVPERIFRGEVFSVTLKVLSTEVQYEDIDYSFTEGFGYKLLTPLPERRAEGRYLYDTFYFKATGSRRMRIPDITASVRFSDAASSAPTTLEGKALEVVTLNPPKNFAHILADSFEITNYKTTRYNGEFNTAIFEAKATRCDIESLYFEGYEKQGADSVEPSHHEATITYYVIIPKELENLKFSYFNLQREKFVDVLIPIIVEDDSVSTQSDLKPTEQSHTLIKVSVAAGIALIALILFVMRRKVYYLVFVILPVLYIADAAVPTEYACIKPNSPIYLLPMERATTFEVTTIKYSLEVQGRIKNYTKVKLHNNKIGWVRNEDLCAR